LKRTLRIAKLEAANIPGGSSAGGSGLLGGAVDRHQKRLKNRADAKVRQAAKAVEQYRSWNGIVSSKFPGPVAGKPHWRDARIRRQYRDGPGWDNTIDVRFDEHGPYFTSPTIEPSAVIESAILAPIDDADAREVVASDIPIPVAVPVESIAAVPDLNPPGPVAENQDIGHSQDEVTPMLNLRTIGQLAKELNADQHQVLYVIRTRKIQPVARAGAYRLFDGAAVDRIASELKRIAAVR
jgi:hypothetical protein